MIIVSQDKNGIINIDNILQLYISRCKKEEITEYYIRYEDCNNSYEDIGTYKTEERAKEVLQEIIRVYTCWENFKYGMAEGIVTPKYEMPED